MTARELVLFASHYPWYLTGYFIGLPLVSGLLEYLHGRDRGSVSPWKYCYSVLVHLACVPGILATILTGYALFFTRENLLDANLIVYILPIVSMIVTLILIRRSVSFDHIPGFDRMSGLMLLLAVTFVIVLGLQRTRIWVIFGSSFFVLIILAAILFLVLKWAAYLLFRRRRRPEFPTLPPK